MILSLLAYTLFAQEFAVVAKKTETDPSLSAASFRWTQTSFDFGNIELNHPVTHEFTFVNSGQVPLVISSVEASCGCTVAQYTKEPIAAGESGFVKATYNAAKTGVFNKTVTVHANTENGITLLSITGTVVQ